MTMPLHSRDRRGGHPMVPDRIASSPRRARDHTEVAHELQRHSAAKTTPADFAQLASPSMAQAARRSRACADSPSPHDAGYDGAIKRNLILFGVGLMLAVPLAFLWREDR